MEKDELATFLVHCGTISYGKSNSEVHAIVQCILVTGSRKKRQTVTRGWWDSFCRCHSELTLRTTAGVSLARSKVTNPKMLGHY